MFILRSHGFYKFLRNATLELKSFCKNQPSALSAVSRWCLGALGKRPGSTSASGRGAQGEGRGPASQELMGAGISWGQRLAESLRGPGDPREGLGTDQVRKRRSRLALRGGRTLSPSLQLQGRWRNLPGQPQSPGGRFFLCAGYMPIF